MGIKVQCSFNRIASSEIWGIDTVNSILRHISFYKDTNVFESKDDIKSFSLNREYLIVSNSTMIKQYKFKRI